MTMNNIAVFARNQPYGDVKGIPDPRTATCIQHQYAAPMTDTGVGYNVDVPAANDWPCVVCAMPNADLIGTEVITTGQSGTFMWGGPDEDRGAGWSSISFSLRGLPNVITCDFDMVAPADTVIDTKDPRITIEKLPKKRDYQDAGPWLPRVDHPALAGMRPTAKKTKREAVEYAARRLAIADFHAAIKAEA